MHVGKQFSFIAYLAWTKRELFVLFLFSLIPTVSYSLFHVKFLVFPLFVATIMGTTVAFVISFKNNAAYARLYEAQKLYAEIQSLSTYFGLQLKCLFNSENREKIDPYIPRLINQHVAWLTVLRYELRKEKVWENLKEGGNRDFSKFFRIFENEISLEAAIQPYLPQNNILVLMSKLNPATYCLQLQIECMKEIFDKDLISLKSFDELLLLINGFNVAQTNCFRIKNSPYPRNFYSITKYFLIGFMIVLPYSLVGELDKIGRVWLTIPVSVLISWMFVCLEKVGQNTTNPFEGGVNDVPITTISREIEIELKQMLEQSDIPEELKPINEILL